MKGRYGCDACGFQLEVGWQPVCGFQPAYAFAARILLLARALRLAPSGHHRFGRVKQSVHGLRLHSISFVISSSQHVVVLVLVVVADYC